MPHSASEHRGYFMSRNPDISTEKIYNPGLRNSSAQKRASISGLAGREPIH
jgi:hypothetical protein